MSDGLKPARAKPLVLGAYRLPGAQGVALEAALIDLAAHKGDAQLTVTKTTLPNGRTVHTVTLLKK
jgi:hypothetical protein